MNTEKKKFITSLYFPAGLLVTIWLIKLTEIVFGINFIYLGIYPLEISGLTGIIFAPLVHASLAHLAANSGPLFFLSIAVFYFYRPVAWKVIFFIWIFTGLWVWVGAREAYHIGASGLVYGYASFIFFSGIIRSSRELMALSLIVVFLYGGMVWGIFPIKETVSWESHLLGAFAGLLLSFYFREYGPKRKKELTDDETELYENGETEPGEPDLNENYNHEGNNTAEEKG